MMTIILHYIILYYIILYYIILYYIILYIIISLYYIIVLLSNYKPLINSNSFSSNYIEYEKNDALFVKEHLNHI